MAELSGLQKIIFKTSFFKSQDSALSLVKEVRLINSEVALLRAIVGMVPPDKKNINPATNAIQSLIALKQNGTWTISLFQNTPAQFHGRPELVEQMTKELSELL